MVDANRDCNRDYNRGCNTGLRTISLALLAVVISAALAVAGTGVSAAQGPATQGPVTCAQILPMVEQNLGAGCANLAADQVCYGNQTVNIEYGNNVRTVAAFARVGDIAPLNIIKSITTSPLNLQTGEWGFAVLRLQTSQPDTTSDQGVTVLLYGDAYLTDLLRTSAEPTPPATCTGTTIRATALRGSPASSAQSIQLLQPNTAVKIIGRSADDLWVQAEVQDADGWLNVQAVKLNCTLSALPEVGAVPPATMPGLSGFYFSTGFGAACKDIPAGGIFIQTPQGTTVTFRANGADITISSAVVLYAKPHGAMSVIVMDGQAIVASHNFQRTVKVGQIVSLPLGGPLGRDVIGPPGAVYRVQSGLVFASSLCRFAKAIGLTDVPCNTAPAARPMN